MKLHPRRATEADSELIFDWRNDPVTISTSRTQTGVEWDGHQKWYPAQLACPDVIAVMVEADSVPAMIVWLRKNRSGIWETSVNSNPAFRGKGLSTQMLRAALDQVRDTTPRPHRFSTEVKQDNPASIKMFERAGFVYVHPSPGFGTYVTL